MRARTKKINSLIQQQMAELLVKNVDFKPNAFVTISKVDTTDDLRYTRIFVRIYPTIEINYGLRTLEHEKKALQKLLHQKLHIKILPRISFVHDKTGEDADEIERLLQQT